MERVILWSNRQDSADSTLNLLNQLSNDCGLTVEAMSEGEALKTINANSDDNGRTIFINKAINWNIKDLANVISLATTTSSDYAAFSFSNTAESVHFPELDIINLINQISPTQTWSLSAISVSNSLLEGLGDNNSINEALIKMAIKATAEGHSINWSLNEILDISDIKEYEFSLTPEQSSDILQFALATVNIEDLFPDRGWQTHEIEVAASCYHTLAARFLSFNDFERARECLQYGDQLEDSPRSLALKGLIALKEGEVLTAVANMVSSLQEYEKRKGSASEGRYIQFKPNNLEVINSNLQNGLAALNKRENESAAEYFTGAVFEFDNFFSKCGLTSNKA